MPFVKRHIFALMALGLFAQVSSCTQDLTQLVVVISSDLGPELHTVGVDITDDAGRQLVSKDFAVSEGRLNLPFSFTVEPGSSFKTASIKVTALALDKDNNVLVERTAELGFVDQQRRRLELALLEVCNTISCPASSETCIDGLCSSTLIDVRTLPVVNPGEEFDALPTIPPVNPDAGTPDSAVGNSDSGLPPISKDGGVVDAAITEPEPSCINVGCPLNQVCVNPREHTFCDAESQDSDSCECKLACDPFGAVLRCGLSSDICTYIQDASPEGQGYCRPDSGGGEQDDICSGKFNDKGELISDTCNRTQNFVCTGINASRAANGRCARVCRADLFLNCQFLLSEVTYECANVSSDQSSILGTCRLPQQEFTDISSSCFNNFDCQSESCLVPNTRGICTSDCSGLETCPSDSTCLPVRVNSDNRFLCFKECETDMECSTKNITNVCHPVGDRKICFPRCNLNNNRCPGSQNQCNRTTGHCE